MRLWSLHPKYLDTKGLVALWREALLAQKVLAGETKGYKNHPQLDRFKAHPRPMKAIGFYLLEIYNEGARRKYGFRKDKILNVTTRVPLIKVSQEQILFEFCHLLHKIERRTPKSQGHFMGLQSLKLHPLFKLSNKGGTWG